MLDAGSGDTPSDSFGPLAAGRGRARNVFALGHPNAPSLLNNLGGRGLPDPTVQNGPVGAVVTSSCCRGGHGHVRAVLLLAANCWPPGASGTASLCSSARTGLRFLQAGLALGNSALLRRFGPLELPAQLVTCCTLCRDQANFARASHSMAASRVARFCPLPSPGRRPRRPRPRDYSPLPSCTHNAPACTPAGRTPWRWVALWWPGPGQLLDRAATATCSTVPHCLEWSSRSPAAQGHGPLQHGPHLADRAKFRLVVYGSHGGGVHEHVVSLRQLAPLQHRARPEPALRHGAPCFDNSLRTAYARVK